MRGCPILPRRFNEKKTTQAATRFLALAGGRMNYMLLIKLLYLLDRRALGQWGRPVTGDDYFSMKYGPVLSEVLDLITDMPDPEGASYWAKHISDPVHYVVELIADPGDDELSEAEEEVIEATFKKFGRYNQFDLANHLHEMLEEWQPVEHGRVPIAYRDILKAIKKSPDEIAAIEEELSALSEAEQMFAPR
jgi:uncharacterized phage-associated protein